MVGIALMLLLAGIFSFSQLDIEAYPDPVQPLIEILALPNGLSAEEVEKLVTVPTEYGLAGMRDLQAMRSISLYGLSDIRCYFSWDSDYYWDRVETINRLSFISLPQGVTPAISPDNPIGEIYRYTVESPDHDLTNEKTSRRLDPRKADQDGAGRRGRFGLRWIDQAVPGRSRSAQAQLLPGPALDVDRGAAELEHQFRRQLYERRRAGVRRSRARLLPQSRRHRQRRAQHQQVHAHQGVQCRRR